MSLIVVLKSMTMYDSIQHLHIFFKDKILPLLSFYVYFSLEFQTVCLRGGFVCLFVLVKQCNLCKHILEDYSGASTAFPETLEVIQVLCRWDRYV